jgi:hypothetical protein
VSREKELDILVIKVARSKSLPVTLNTCHPEKMIMTEEGDQQKFKEGRHLGDLLEFSLIRAS